MRQRSDGDDVDPGFRGGRRPFERHASRSLDDRAAARDPHRALHHRVVHVVEQHRIGARGDRLAHLLERVALDLDDRAGRRVRARPLNCRADRTRGRQMIVLDEDRVGEAHPVVRSAAGPNRVAL